TSTSSSSPKCLPMASRMARSMAVKAISRGMPRSRSSVSRARSNSCPALTLSLALLMVVLLMLVSSEKGGTKEVRVQQKRWDTSHLGCLRNSPERRGALSQQAGSPGGPLCSRRTGTRPFANAALVLGSSSLTPCDFLVCCHCCVGVPPEQGQVGGI